MPIISNYGMINYTTGGQSGTLTSNTVETDINVSYATRMLKGASPTEYAPGSAVTYQVYVENTGTGMLTDPEITDNLGIGLLNYTNGSVTTHLYSSDQQVVDSPAVTTRTTSGGVTFNVTGSIPTGYFLVLTYQATVNENLPATVTEITNTANLSVSSGGGTIHTDDASAVILRQPLTIVKTASSDSVTPGDPLTYTFTLTNAQDSAVTVNTLTDPLPANFTVGDTITASIGGRTVTYQKGTDFTVSNDNLLTIAPAAGSTPLTVPAATAAGASITVITIPGTITA